MYPTLIPGDRLLVLRHWPDKWLYIGQVVVVDLNKVSTTLETVSKIVKRVVGLPGDKVVIHISDLHERMRLLLQSECDPEGNLVWCIPPGHCFLRGDGRIGSDSVTWGPLPLDSITGVMLIKLQRWSD